MFLVRFGALLFITYATLAIVCLLLIETTFNGGFLEVETWALPITAVASFFFVKTYFEAIKRETRYSTLKIWITTALVALLVAFFTWPYAQLFNAISAEGTETAYLGGRLIKKFTASGKTTSHVFVLAPPSVAEPVKLQVSDQTYEAVSIGQNYHECFAVGGLGWPFRWRYAEEPPKCAGAPPSAG